MYLLLFVLLFACKSYARQLLMFRPVAKVYVTDVSLIAMHL